MTFSLAHFWFGIYSAFSGQTFYESWLITFFNLLFTAFPILMYAIFEQDVHESSVEDKYPQLYRDSQKNTIFTLKKAWLWIFNGVYHSLICFYIPYLIMGLTSPFPNGQMIDNWSLSTTTYTCVIFVVTFKIAFETQYWTWINHLFTWGSMLAWIAFAFIYSSLQDWFLSPNEMFWIFMELTMSLRFYLTILITMTIALLPDAIILYISHVYYPLGTQIIHEMEKTGFPIDDNLFDKSRPSYVPPKLPVVQPPVGDEKRRITIDVVGGEEKDISGFFQTPEVFAVIQAGREAAMYTGYAFAQDAGEGQLLSKREKHAKTVP